jgi:hypothetical protein
MKTFKQLREGLMYQGKPLMPQTKKPETTIKSATPSGHKKYQKRAGRKIDQ